MTVSDSERATLEAEARRTGVAFARVDLTNVTTRAAFLETLGRALSLPRGHAKDWDTLYDSLTELDLESDEDGTVILLENAGAFVKASPSDWIEALAVLRAVAEDWKEDDVPFWVCVSGASVDGSP